MTATQPPYRRIAAALRARILDGDLRPGDRLPSVRQIARDWNVALATAGKVVAVLRDEGLVTTTVGSGAVVGAVEPAGARAAETVRPSGTGRESTGPGWPPSGSGSTAVEGHRGPTGPGPTPRSSLDLVRILAAAMPVADAEGLDAVSMRRLAAELGIGPMSLYRHVANREELVGHLVDTAFGEIALPAPEPLGWRAALELISRRQWDLCQRHFWLPQAISFTRPLLTPRLTAQTEWTLRALDGLGLDLDTRMRQALTLHGFVMTAARSLAAEVEAEQETGVTLHRWHRDHRDRAAELLRGQGFPLLAQVSKATASDLDGLFEYGLARQLDGFAVLLERRRP